ncbi:hypothetical protein [Geminocystis sp.]|uniref:hypothetical protein n=1 Tax=Geminocystis sp. TaxID=2664100 RepID=UPI00359488D3
MVLNKFFGKKKETYFLEIETKTDSESSSTVVNSTSEIATTEEKEAIVTTTIKPQVNISDDTPEWVKAIKNYSHQSNNTSTSEAENFAGKYVSNSVPQSHRRPGPSLDGFKSMASKIGK